MAELFDDFLVEIRKNVLREKQSGKTKYIFVPEKSATWYNIKMSSMKDVSYPYNNHITLESLKDGLTDILKKEYPDCKTDGSIYEIDCDTKN